MFSKRNFIFTTPSAVMLVAAAMLAAACSSSGQSHTHTTANHNAERARNVGSLSAQSSRESVARQLRNAANTSCPGKPVASVRIEKTEDRKRIWTGDSGLPAKDWRSFDVVGRTDIDSDGAMELLLSETGACGEGDCPRAIFVYCNGDNHIVDLGQARSVRVASTSSQYKGRGYVDFLVDRRDSASQNADAVVEVRLSYNGDGYLEVPGSRKRRGSQK